MEKYFTILNIGITKFQCNTPTTIWSGGICSTIIFKCYLGCVNPPQANRVPAMQTVSELQNTAVSFK
jgi:hypothetical protein